MTDSSILCFHHTSTSVLYFTNKDTVFNRSNHNRFFWFHLYSSHTHPRAKCLSIHQVVGYSRNYTVASLTLLTSITWSPVPTCWVQIDAVGCRGFVFISDFGFYHCYLRDVKVNTTQFHTVITSIWDIITSISKVNSPPTATRHYKLHMMVTKLKALVVFVK